MTLDDLIAAFRFDADDTVKKYQTSDVDIVRFLNEAENEACVRARLIFDASTPEVCSIAILAGVSVYPLHPSIHEVNGMTHIVTSRSGVQAEMAGASTFIEAEFVRQGTVL